MKRIIIAGWISILLLFFLPLISFGNGVSERSEGVFVLETTYYDLEGEFPVIGMVSVDETDLSVIWEGKQNKVVTPSENHNHHVKVEDAIGLIRLKGVKSSEFPFPIPEILILVVIESASMNEHGTGETSDTKTVDVFLRAKSVQIMPFLPPVPVLIDLGPGMLKIEDGQIKFLKLKAFPAPGKSRVRVTTFGKIKSGR